MSERTLIESFNIGIKKGCDDSVCFSIPDNSSVSIVTTKNKFAAAPVILSRKHINIAKPKYILVNSGNANACTGQQGINNALLCMKYLSKKFQCKKENILMFSTGIIGKQLPIQKMTNLINKKTFKFKSTWKSAAKAIMTTDSTIKSIKKSFLVDNKKITINAICKGAGMIEPNMATMLSFIEIDVKIPRSKLNSILKKSVDKSFNSISVDGDMSTNDSVVLIANGKNKIDFSKDSNIIKIEKNILDICQNLSKKIISDGEGATKVITINIKGSKSYKEAKKIAYSISNSNLIKTAMFGSDPNWGRIIARLGSIENINLIPEKVIMKINGHNTFSRGMQDKLCDLKLLNKSMKRREISIEILLNLGKYDFSMITSDLTTKYVSINSEYTS